MILFVIFIFDVGQPLKQVQGSLAEKNAEELPPLPDLLEGIKLRFTHPKEIVVSPDTGKLSIGLGNPLFGEIFFPFTKRKIKIGALANYFQGNDYRKYTSYSGNGFLAMPFAKLSGSYNRKIRGKDYYETKSLSVIANPLDNQKIGLSVILNANQAKYFYNNLSNFNYYFSSISYRQQTFFGKLTIEPEFIYQTKAPTTFLFSVSDFILFKNLSYLKPGFGYFLNENKFFTKSEAGIFLGSFVFLLRFITQQPTLLRFDSLYSDPGLFRVNPDLEYPLTRLKIVSGILFRGIEFNLVYSDFERYITYFLADSLLIPINSPQRLRQLGFSLKKDFAKFQNNFLVALNYDSLSLVPSYLIYDSVTLFFKPIVFKVSAKILGEQYFEKRLLKPALIFSPEVSYQDGFNKKFNYQIGLRIENLFNNKYEIYPEKFDSGFRLTVQFALNRAF